MMIRVKSSGLGDDVMVQICIGRKGKTASYDLVNRGTLCMAKDEWLLFKRTLERGAVRPVVVVTEEVDDLTDPKPVDDAKAKEASPF